MRPIPADQASLSTAPSRMRQERDTTSRIHTPWRQPLRRENSPDKVRVARRARARRIGLLACLIVPVFGVAVERAVRSYSAAPRLEPRFEGITWERPGPIKSIALREIEGAARCE